jgi:hypothetical protein
MITSFVSTLGPSRECEFGVWCAEPLWHEVQFFSLRAWRTDEADQNTTEADWKETCTIVDGESYLRYMRQIDGLRALAVAGVFIDHFIGVWVPVGNMGVITIAVASLSWHFYEKPLNSLKRYFNCRRLRAVGNHEMPNEIGDVLLLFVPPRCEQAK